MIGVERISPDDGICERGGKDGVSILHRNVEIKLGCLRAFGQFETIQRRLAWPLH